MCGDEFDCVKFTLFQLTSSLLSHPLPSLLPPPYLLPSLPSSKVNADIKKFVLEDGAPRLFQVDTTTVGVDISTKAVGSEQRVDVTDSVGGWSKVTFGSGHYINVP